MEIKQGDKVKVSKDAPRMYLRGWAQVFQIRESEVIKVEDDNAVIETFELSLAIPTKYLIKVDAEAKEPTAPTIKVGDRVRCKNPIRLANSTDDDFIGTVTDAENGWFIVRMNNGAIFQTYHESDLELVQPKEQTEAEKMPKVGSIKIPVEVDLTDSYWDAYTADLAKEIALKVANKYNDPEQAAEYAVEVAKAVVEGLKGK